MFWFQRRWANFSAQIAFQAGCHLSGEARATPPVRAASTRAPRKKNRSRCRAKPKAFRRRPVAASRPLPTVSQDQRASRPSSKVQETEQPMRPPTRSETTKPISATPEDGNANTTSRRDPAIEHDASSTGEKTKAQGEQQRLRFGDGSSERDRVHHHQDNDVFVVLQQPLLWQQWWKICEEPGSGSSLTAVATLQSGRRGVAGGSAVLRPSNTEG